MEINKESYEIAVHQLRAIARDAIHGCYTSDRVNWSLFDAIKRSADAALSALESGGQQ